MIYALTKLNFSIQFLHQILRMFESFPHLVYSKRHLPGVLLLKFVTPPPFEVDRVNQNQLGLCIDGVSRQQLSNLTLGRSREYKA